MRVLLVLAFLCLSALSVVAHPTPNPLSYVNSYTKINLDGNAYISASNPELIGTGGWVTINWGNIPSPQQYDFIALYSPPLNVSDFANLQGHHLHLPYPIKYFNLTEPNEVAPSGSLRTFLINMRADYSIAYVSGTVKHPELVAVSSTNIYFTSYTLPMQIHLSRDIQPSSMRVTWVNSMVSQPIVQFGLAANNLTSVVAATNDTYTADYLQDKAVKYFRQPGYILSGVMTHLSPNTDYYYQVGEVNGFLSDVYHFKTHHFGSSSLDISSSDTPTDFIIFGDMGQTEYDNWENHKEQVSSLNTTLSIYADIKEKVVHHDTVVLHIGDISYARGYASLWDNFFYQIQPIATIVPYMTGIGNHEFDFTTYFDNHLSLFNNTESGGEVGVPYIKRMIMPTIDSVEKVWYSFVHNSITFIMISTEHDFRIGSAQYEDIETMLYNVDRTVTPWVIVTGHRPVYIDTADTACPDSDACISKLFQQHLEPLFLKHGVDVVFNGHHHSYQRTCFLKNGACVQDPKDGILYIITGAGGFEFSHFNDNTPAWIAYETNQHHGYVRAFANTGASKTNANGQEHTLLLQFVDATSRQVEDSIQLNLAVSANNARNKYVSHEMAHTPSLSSSSQHTTPMKAPTDYMFDAWPELLQDEEVVSRL